MWREGLFVFDANVLLNLYRYSDETRFEFVRIMRAVREQLWIPHQAAQEYLDHRLDIIYRQKQAYPNLRKSLNTAREKIEREMNALHRDTVPKVAELLQAVQKPFEDLTARIEELDSSAIEISNSPEDDEVWKEVTELFSGKVGDSYTDKQQQEVVEKGQKRYEADTPPGYKDANKGGDRQYGDLVLWLQIIDKAKESNKPMVLVTDDRKDDWWQNFHGDMIGPRPELVDEMAREAGVPFYMYTPDRFMSWAGDSLPEKVSAEAIGEVEELGSRDEAEHVEDYLPLLGVIEELPVQERTLVDLIHRYDFTLEEASRVLAISPKKASQLMRNALNSMRDRVPLGPKLPAESRNTPLPTVATQDVLYALGHLGYDQQRLAHQHVILSDKNRGAALVVPIGREIGPAMLRNLLKEADVTNEEFLAALG